MELLRQGERVADIARFLGLHTDTIYRWKVRLDRDGPRALDAKPHSGRPAKLTPEQLAELEAVLGQGAKAQGYADDLWNGPRVQQVIADHFGVDYHVDHVRKLLHHKLHYSSQKPEKKAYERDPWDIHYFRQAKFDRLFGHAQDHDQHLIFLDESGFQLTPNVRRGYAPVGRTPILECSAQKQRLTVISCVTVSPCLTDVDLYFQILDPNENATARDIVDFLDQVRQDVPRQLVMWDGARIHAHSLVVREFLASHPEIDEETLPAYAPEFNPDEYVWTYLKHSRMYHYAPTNVIDLYDRLEHELDDLSHRRHLLRGFVNHSELTLQL